jgi:uracil-DNA glycosylase
MTPAARPARDPSRALDALVAEIRTCRLCRDRPDGPALPHEPRPVLRVSTTARIGVFGQAPGTRVHASGKPFTDPSGVRLRSWMSVTDDEFYDAARIAIVPMGFCFPGLDANGGDLPPRRECAPLWRQRLMATLPALELVLLVGQYAQRWHLGAQARSGLTDTVRRWGEIVDRPGRPILVPLPHPSWRNNGWIKRNPWFDEQLVPWLQVAVRKCLLPRPQ